MKKIFKKYHLLCYLITVHGSFAQEITEISGKVIDEESKQPIPYAHIGLVGGTLGTVSNNEGAFIIKFPATQDPQKLGISSMGYSSVQIPVKEALKEDSLVVALAPVAIQLEEVVVRPTNPENLIREAIAKIPENYATVPVMLTGFYRELIYQGEDLASLAEAVISIHKSSYTNHAEKDQMKLLKGRKSQDENSSEILQKMTISGGLNVDFVKYGMHFLLEENFKFYHYELTDVLMSENNPVYVVEFDQKKNIKKPLLKGKLYIDVNTLAFQGVEYGYSPRGIQYANQRKGKDKRKMKKAGVQVETLYANTKVNYRPYQGKWYLHDAQSDYQVKVNMEDAGINEVITYRSDLLITDIDTTQVVEFDENERLVTLGKDLGEQIEEPYDEDFWEDYNILKSSEKLQKNVDQLLNSKKDN